MTLIYPGKATLQNTSFFQAFSPTSGSQLKRNCTPPALLTGVVKCKIEHVICFLCLS